MFQDSAERRPATPSTRLHKRLSNDIDTDLNLKKWLLFFCGVPINDACFFYLSFYGAFRSRKIGGSLKGINRGIYRHEAEQIVNELLYVIINIKGLLGKDMFHLKVLFH